MLNKQTDKWMNEYITLQSWDLWCFRAVKWTRSINSSYNPRPPSRMRSAMQGAVRVSRCWSVFPAAASPPRSNETHGSDGGRVKMPRLRFSLQGPHPATVLSQCLPGLRPEHHRADSGRRDPGAEPSLVRLRLPGHGQDEPVQRDRQRVRVLHAVPAQVSKRGAGVSSGQPPPTLLPHLPAVPPERLPGWEGAPGLPSEPAAGGHHRAVPAEPPRCFYRVLIHRAEVPAVRPQPGGRDGDVRAVRRVLL